jgi:asparagine synthase (glutamine-hydrolysing)
LRFVSDLPGQKFQQAFSESAGLSTINKAQWLDLQTFLPEDILTKVDVASMSVGLEVRPPILDRRVFQLAASIPETELWQDDRGYCGKLALKELAAARFGHEFAFRRKQGFEIPLERWLRGTEQRRDEVAQQLLDPRCGLVNWFCPEQLQLAVSSGTVYNLWLLCVLREWRQQNAS